MNKCIIKKQIVANDLNQCQNLFIALGNETRLNIINTILTNENTGMRVGEITKQTHLSRPAVSHHLKILKESGIISLKKKGTMNFYYINTQSSKWKELKKLIDDISLIIKSIDNQEYQKNI